MIYRQYHDAGFRIFGLYGANEHGICLCDNPQCNAPYKHPIAKGWQHTPEWDDDQLSAMEIAGHFDTGFGVLCNGFIVVDIDARNGGVESYQQLNEDLGGALLSAGMIVRTGSGGGSRHLYFKAPAGVSLQTKLTAYPGIDFKSSGYVVGAGSLHASGARYELLEGSPDDITEAPQVLIDLLARPETHRTSINDRQIDVTDNDLSSMLAHISPDCDYEEWVRCGMAIHHSTNGAGFEIWDAWSAKGAKYPGSKALSKRWDSFGKSDKPVTLGTLAHYAEMNGWKYPVEFLSEEFQARTTGLFIPVGEMMSAMKKPDWVIKGLIERGSSNLLFGESGAGKSLFALDWAYCIGTGRTWHGHKVKKSEQVVYIAGEGHRGLTLRMQALTQKYGAVPDNIFFSQRSVNLLDEKEAQAITKIIEDMAVIPAVVFIDTLHRNMVGDENKSDDMAKFFKCIELLIAKLGCAIVLVHHSGHGDKTRARGSSAIKAAMDAEFCVSKEGMTSILTCTKSKDFEGGLDVRFGIKQVELMGSLFYDEDDDKQITSVFLEYIGVDGAETKLNKNDALMLEALEEAIHTKGKNGAEFSVLGADKVLVSIDTWRFFAKDKIKDSNKFRAFDRARKSLKTQGLVENDGDWWWIV